MYLKSIKANGFKSFADHIQLLLENNITCVVGPNGSGKSNIVDAVRWVLGEQSVKSLRGTNSMSDIIFAGSTSRNGANRAEVSLTFDNSDHYLNSEYSEIEIKRILYKNGEGEYFINNSRVRLKDITDLFIDSGAGTDSFNIISQGKIESVVNSKPTERRIIFEEAAEVLKYKKRKEESLRKLEKTQENISKIELIIQELKTTLNPLKEQSENAQKYLDLKKQLEQIEISSITYDIHFLKEKYDGLEKDILSLNEELLKLDTTSSDEMVNIENLKLKNIKLDESISELNAKLLSVTSHFVNLQNEKVMYAERKKYEGKVLNADKDIISLKEDILSLDQSIAVLKNELESLNEQLRKLDHELQDVNEQQSLNKVKYAHLNTNYQKNVQELYSLKSKEESLEISIQNDSKLPNSVKCILNNDRLKGVYGTIGKLLEIPNEYLTSIDVALGASSNFLVVENENIAKECIHYLKEKKFGRATFFPLNIIKEKHISKDIIKQLECQEGYIGIASDLVSFDSKFENVIKNQLGNVLIVNSIEDMNRIGKLLEFKYRIVTLDGEIMHTGGSLTGGSFKNNSVLNDKSILEEVRTKIALLEEQLKKMKSDIEGFDQEENILREKEEIIHRNKIQIQEKINEKTNNIDLKKRKQLELNKELEGIVSLKNGDVDEKLMALMNEVNEAETSKTIIETNLNAVKSEKSALVSQIEELEHIYKEKNSSYNKLQNELKNKEIQLGKLDIQLDNLLQTLNESYNLTYEKAKITYVLEMDIEEARKQVKDLKNNIALLGEVNVFAIEEFERVNTRYEFLTNQKNDLEEASSNLTTVIHQMDEIMIDKFNSTFYKINEEFKSVFRKLFKGGNGMLKLTDPDNILETGVEIIAEPPGKKLKSIGLLSGGEKTLTAIALLFSILNVKTVPFCILDEVEAALDEVNVDAFGQYLQEKKESSQFILITHKKRTMEYADNLYGITMQESGVSKIVSVKLENV